MARAKPVLDVDALLADPAVRTIVVAKSTAPTFSRALPARPSL